MQDSPGTGQFWKKKAPSPSRRGLCITLYPAWGVSYQTSGLAPLM